MRVSCLSLATLLVVPPVAIRAQSAGFITMLGADTVQVEQFTRSGNRIEGALVTRSPVTRLHRFTITLDTAGRLAQYSIEAFGRDGRPLGTNWSAGSLHTDGDSVTRTSLRDGEQVVTRVFAPFGVIPGAMLPYLGVPFVVYELGLAQARRLVGVDTATAWYPLTISATQARPQRTRVWLIGADSVEADYFGVARIGYRYNEHGQLLRADWRATTYKYLVRRVAMVNIGAVATSWWEADARGAAMGAVSPRDTVRAVVGTAAITLEYSRPAQRGREIWGGLVPWGAVWRFGADFATHLTTSAPISVGSTSLPAGTYTLWMLPTGPREAQLIVSGLTRVFGTQYAPARDVARIALTRDDLSPLVERFTLLIEGGRLRVRWADAEWWVPISSP